jgi:DUF4097 and DUF4098 domain-containing protein YvlB
MKNSSVFIGVAVMFILIVAAVSATTFDQDKGQPFRTKTFTLDGPGDLKVRTSGGGIAVTSQQGHTAIVKMYVRKRGRTISAQDEDAKEILENLDITIEQSGNTISAIAERRSTMFSWFGSNNASVSFTVVVPEQMSCDLNTSGGSIELSGVRGRQEVKTSGGGLTLTGVSGNTNARTSGGGITIEGYAGTLEAHTSGGPINLHEASGELRVSTSGGGIKLDRVKGSINANTSGGGIRAEVLSLDKYLTLKTSGGSITAVLPSGLGLDLDLRGDRVNSKLVNFNGQAEKNRVRGSMNGGGVPVVMSTSGGSVNLEYR